ncbi:MAG: glutamate-5-semialdehyde dehydrogenase [Kiritimatiellia bacterium]
MNIKTLASEARAASVTMATLPLETRNAALLAIARALEAETASIEAANQEDIAAAQRDDLAPALLKRLAFGAGKIADSVAGLESLERLPDPVGRVHERRELAPGLELSRVSCPIGVVGIIFESRPDALVQISALCLKSGNCCLLKGGREAIRTNRRLFETIRAAAAAAGVPDGWIQLLETREDVGAMLALDESIDLLIPRGSNAFVRYIMDNTRIPVMGHADGICHVYVDKGADLAMAVDVVEDAKCQYPAVCNAVETLLVHADVAAAFLPALAERLARRGVRLLGCERARGFIACEPATEADWDAEYLDLVLGVKVVDGFDAAVRHINAHGSGHTDAIVTQDAAAAEAFMDRVDSADVFWNCSTRFADGFRFGLGAEVGISTSKLHSRGPVGLDGLMSYKWKLRGGGHVVTPFAEGRSTFTHVELPVE